MAPSELTKQPLASKDDQFLVEIIMKKSALFLAISALATGSAFANTFVNGGFETGNLTGWTGSGGCWGAYSVNGTYPWSCTQAPPNVSLDYTPLPLNPNLFTGAANNTIVSGGIDPHTGLSRVYNGSYAVRVNDDINNYGVSVLKQSVTNYTDQYIYFQWQAVLESSHGLTDSDYFSLTLTDTDNGTVLLSRAYSSAGSIGSGAGNLTWTQYGNWYSAGWVLETIDLAALNAMGKNLTLTLLASDCPYGGHAGYVYLDGFAPTIVNPGPNPTPEPATLAMLGLGLLGLGAARMRKAA